MSDLDLNVVDVRDFLKMLEVENVTDDGEEARFSCPYPAHGFGDKNPSAYMNLETTAFICFGCGERGNAITFLADVKGVTRLIAKNWIAQKWAPRYAQIDNLRSFVESMIKKQQEDEEPPPEFIPLPEVVITEGRTVQAVDWESVDTDWAEYMFDRGFTGEILNRFGFVYDAYRNRPCITVRTPEGGLVGFKGRAWLESQHPKYMVIGDTPRSLEEHGVVYGFEPYDASHWVFGAHIAKPIDGVFILREGELNVVSMHQKGFTNTIGPSGSTLSDMQVDWIVDHCDEVIIFFDTDAHSPESYATANEKIMKALRAFENRIRVRVVRDHEGDPDEMTKEEIEDLMSDTKSSIRYQVEARLQDVS